MKVLGISALSHDASVAMIEDGKILFAAHSERSSGKKNDAKLTRELVKEAIKHGLPDKIAFYENVYKKKTRQAYSGQWDLVWDIELLPDVYIKYHFPELAGIPIESVDHHLSHAATGALTSGFKDAAVVVCDAIGEWDCITIWKYKAPCSFTKVYKKKYPDSLGLFYTAITDRVGLKPNEDEYILMGMAAYGKPIYKDEMLKEFFVDNDVCTMKRNLHLGCKDFLPDANDFDLAASAQAVIEEKIDELMRIAREKTGLSNLVYAGGVALNCVANYIPHKHFDDVWILPNPGDAGSSLGCAGVVMNRLLKWKTPFLGHNIHGRYPVDSLVKELTDGNIVGVASGRAEFGPRALGHRSLIADPRGDDIKDRMNEIKHRQKFRPFAPAILEEYVHDYFEMPEGVDKSPYMQYIAKVKDPKTFPAITHEDGTARVQTVNKKDNPNFYKLIKAFYEATGCPMIVNTSLNVKGKPMVDDLKHVAEFEKKYKVKVFTDDSSDRDAKRHKKSGL